MAQTMVEKSSDWVVDFSNEILTNNKRVFIISGNIYDLVSVGSCQFNSIEDFFKSLFSKTFEFHFQFNLSSGSKLLKGDVDEFVGLIGINQDGMSEEDKEIMESAGIDLSIPREPKELFSRLTKFFKESKKRTLFVIQYAESIFGCDPGVSQNNEELVVAFKEWARNSKISENGHLILVLTKHAEDLDSSMLDRDIGVSQFRIPKPDLQKRTFFLESLKVDKEDIGIASLLTSGLSLRVIESIIKDNNEKFLLEKIFEQKFKILEEDYGDVVDVMKPKWGFDCIGGLEDITQKLKYFVRKMTIGEFERVPQAILFTGPPGTGKTVCAEALAKEACVNMVEFGPIRSKWVGSTEKRLSKFKNACIDMAPVMVFVDEIDKAFGRSSDPDGSGGVERRFMQSMLKIIGDSSFCGKIFWMGTTNEPQAMNSALLRSGRFSERIFFPPPDAKTREKIFKAIMVKYPNIKTDITDWKEFAKLTENRTGADIEVILKEKAWVCADMRGQNIMTREDVLWAIGDFVPHQLRKEELQEMLVAGVRASSSKSFIPDKFKHLLDSPEDKKKAFAPKEKITHDVSFLMESDLSKKAN